MVDAGSFIYLQQVKETGDSYLKLCLSKEGPNPCLNTLFGQLYIDFSWIHLLAWVLVQLILSTAAVQNITVLQFTI